MAARRRHAAVGHGWSIKAPLPLVGSWVAPDPVKKTPVAGTALKLTPYTVLPGQEYAASWGGTGGTFGTSFTDQGLQFTAGPGVSAGRIASPDFGVRPGLGFSAAQESTVTITFASPVVLTGLTGVWVVGGETPFLSPRVSSGGQPVDPTASSQDPSGVFLLSFSATVSEIDILVSSWPLYLMSLTWETPDIDMPVLPQAPGLYALKVVTQIQAGQPDSNGHVSYQPVADGDPVIEFAYLQTASGPGTATVEPAPVGSGGFTTPDPDRTPPTPKLAAAAATPATAFPNGGRLNDLSTYTQWSWPRDGDAAAYYGYDLNVEFTETYVNALYATFLTSGAPYQYTGDPLIPALHLRCVDRNQRHTLLMPSEIHVPSAPPQSANVSRVLGRRPTAGYDQHRRGRLAGFPADQRAGIGHRGRRRAAATGTSRRDHTGPDRQASVRRRHPGRGAHDRAGRARPGALRQPGHDREPPARTRRTRRRSAGAQPVVRTPGAPDAIHRRRRGRPASNRPRRHAHPGRRQRRAVGHLRRHRRDRRPRRAPGLPGPGGRPHLAAAGAVHHLPLRHLLRPGGQRHRPVRRHRRHAGPPVCGTQREPTPRTWLAAADTGTDVAKHRTDRRTDYLNARQTLADVLAEFDPLYDVRQAAPPVAPPPATANRRWPRSAR